MKSTALLALSIAALCSGCNAANQEDCVADAAASAKDEAAIQAALSSCYAKFPARRGAAGGYEFLDPVSGEYVVVSGPELASGDLAKINAARAEWQRDQPLPSYSQEHYGSYEPYETAVDAATLASQAADGAAAAASEAAARDYPDYRPYDYSTEPAAEPSDDTSVAE